MGIAPYGHDLTPGSPRIHRPTSQKTAPGRARGSRSVYLTVTLTAPLYAELAAELDATAMTL